MDFIPTYIYRSIEIPLVVAGTVPPIALQGRLAHRTSEPGWCVVIIMYPPSLIETLRIGLS
jgi:hypothetical protein